MNRPVRRSQAISPFGIGALIDFPGPVSLVHAGLDAWPLDPSKPEHQEFKVEDEPRLARRLGVDFFVQPPDFRTPSGAGPAKAVNVGLRLPFLRFPLWHSCPRCGRMFETRYQDRSAPQCSGPVGSGTDKGKPHNPRRTVQVRFVTVCRDGHMRDFPWIEWLGLEPDEWNRTRPDRWLRLLSTGSASIAGVIVVAERRQTEGAGIVEVKRRSLAGAFGSELGVKCDSQIPALGIGDGGDVSGEECPQKLQAVLRGASNLYFSDVRSSIYIPEVRDAAFPQDVLDILEDHEFKQELLSAAIIADTGTLSRKAVSVILKRRRPESTVDAATLATAANKHVLHEALTQHRLTATMLAMRANSNEGSLSAAIVAEVIGASHVSEWEIDPGLLVEPLNSWLDTRNADAPEEGGASSSEFPEGTFRFEEYATFCRDGQEGMPKINLLVRSHPTDAYEPVVRDRFSRVALLDKLRETRAFVGYSRLFAASTQDSAKRWKLISRDRKNWLPAIVVRGEGIFLVFDSARLDRWNSEHGAFHRQRLVAVNRNLQAQARRREIHVQDVDPKFVLLHTFAHAVISQLTFDCGYGSSSLRERIYFSDDHPRMSGVLIYTAAGDSEGTMGGLVRMGSPRLLERTIARALDRARWCSSDPVCIESPGQGPDNCNLAACHSCALLPETSCEQQNRLLDRAMLVGTLDHPESGFFFESE